MRRRRIETWRAGWPAAALYPVAAFSLAVGCVDIDPITVQAAVVDAAPPPADGDEPSACDKCIEAPNSPGPGCGDEIAVCRTDARCTMVLECTAPLHCYEKPTQAEVNDCGLPCFRMVAGNTLPTDLIMMLLNVFSCTQNACGPACHPP